MLSLFQASTIIWKLSFALKRNVVCREANVLDDEQLRNSIRLKALIFLISEGLELKCSSENSIEKY